MEDDGLNMKNWGYYYQQPPLKGHLNLQLMSSMAEQDVKPFPIGNDNPFLVPPNGAFRHTEPPVTHLDYVRDTWINHRDKFLHMFPSNSYMYNSVLTEQSKRHNSIQMITTKETELVSIEESSVKKDSCNGKKRSVSMNAKPPKAKKSMKRQNVNSSGKTAKKNMDVVINGIDLDISDVAIPVCSCTGTPQQCYRWGCGGWQSACCTTTISMNPLPMSTKRRGARIAGRKMSRGAFKKVLEKLGAEGYDFSDPIDLKNYWAKHGTNKFVTIR